MAMRNYLNFNEAKEFYIERVLYHIHYKKFGKRIKEEIASHMDDMYDDFKNDFDNELDVAKKVIDEMGDPDELGLELKEANKRKLFIARLFKIAIGLGIIPLTFFVIVLITNIYDEVHTYFYATDIETKEMQIIEKCNDGKPIKLLIEFEDNGIIHRFYLPEEKKETGYTLFHTESIKVFNISIKDKFSSYGASNGANDNVIQLCKERYAPIQSCYYIFLGPTAERYIKLYYEPIDSNSGLEPYWSDFIEYPQNGTYDEPIIIFEKCPAGYRHNTYKRFDENKNIYRPEPTSDVNDCDSNGIRVHSSTVTY